MFIKYVKLYFSTHFVERKYKISIHVEHFVRQVLRLQKANTSKQTLIKGIKLNCQYDEY